MLLIGAIDYIIIYNIQVYKTWSFYKTYIFSSLVDLISFIIDFLVSNFLVKVYIIIKNKKPPFNCSSCKFSKQNIGVWRQ